MADRHPQVIRHLIQALPALALAALLGVTQPAAATELRGQFVQGGVIFGTTEPGARVSLDGREVRVSAAGRFVFGFGRDATGPAQLLIKLPDGRSEARTLQIEARQYPTERVNGLPPKMVTPPQEVLDRIERENARIAAARAVDRPQPYFEGGFVWPAIGRITGVFGSQRILNGEPRRPHFGLDIAAPQGTPVRAPAGGVVAIAQADMYYTGGTVLLDHGHGLTSVYSHLHEVAVREGQVLRQGDLLGTMGATGRASGVHLDWRINWFEERLDPAFFVPPMTANAGQ